MVGVDGELNAYSRGKSFELETVDEMENAGWKRFLGGRVVLQR